MEEVRVSLCKNGDDCEEEDELQKEEEEGYPPAFYLDKVDLAPGQGYELVVSFIHNGEEVAEIREAFTTKLDLSQMEPEAVAVDDEVQVKWREVEGADHYLVYRQYGAGEDPEIVTNVSDPEAAGLPVFDQRPCSTATYLVQVCLYICVFLYLCICLTTTYLQAVKEGLEEQPRIPSNAVTVLPNNTEPFKAEELKEDGEDQRLEWKHMGPCIAGYTVTFTSQDGTELTDEVES